MYTNKKVTMGCPDCSGTLCNCGNCHTMHCDSEQTCGYFHKFAVPVSDSLKVSKEQQEDWAKTDAEIELSVAENSLKRKAKGILEDFEDV